MQIFKKVDIIVTPTTGYASSLFLFLYGIFYLSLCVLPIIETRNLKQRPNPVLSFILQKQGCISCIVKINRYFTHRAISMHISCFQQISDAMITTIAIITAFLHSAFMISCFQPIFDVMITTIAITTAFLHSAFILSNCLFWIPLFCILSWELWTSACFGPVHMSRL